MQLCVTVLSGFRVTTQLELFSNYILYNRQSRFRLSNRSRRALYSLSFLTVAAQLPVFGLEVASSQAGLTPTRCFSYTDEPWIPTEM